MSTTSKARRIATLTALTLLVSLPVGCGTVTSTQSAEAGSPTSSSESESWCSMTRTYEYRASYQGESTPEEAIADAAEIAEASLSEAEQSATEQQPPGEGAKKYDDVDKAQKRALKDALKLMKDKPKKVKKNKVQAVNEKGEVVGEATIETLENGNYVLAYIDYRVPASSCLSL